ncbi:MAG: YbaN family protein [Planctomycetota bacterium]
MTGRDEKTTLFSRLRGASLISAGWICTGLAIAGVVLPLVPTTPFLLLAAACFVRSSPRFHRWLLANRVFGPILEQWRRDKTVPRSAKRKAYLVVILSFGLSIALVDVTWLRAALFVLGSGLIVFIARLPTTRAQENPQVR